MNLSIFSEYSLPRPKSSMLKHERNSKTLFMVSNSWLLRVKSVHCFISFLIWKKCKARITSSAFSPDKSKQPRQSKVMTASSPTAVTNLFIPENWKKLEKVRKRKYSMTNYRHQERAFCAKHLHSPHSFHANRTLIT